jgi:hypothetical protein
MLILGFVAGIAKNWTYGLVLLLHGISTVSSYRQYGIRLKRRTFSSSPRGALSTLRRSCALRTCATRCPPSMPERVLPSEPFGGTIRIRTGNLILAEHPRGFIHDARGPDLFEGR